MNKRSHTTTRPDGATIPAGLYGGCMVAALADRLRTEREAIRMQDNSTNIGVSDQMRVGAIDDNALDIERVLMDMISCNMAQSLEGAAMQIAAIYPRLEALENLIPYGSEGAIERKDYRAMVRLLYSALRAVNRHCQIPLDDLVDPQYAKWRLDPWLSLDERQDCDRAANG